MISFFRSKEKKKVSNHLLKVDIHSHLIPFIDDGCQDLTESLQLIRDFSSLGYQKLVITPHVMEGYFPNTPETIGNGLRILQEAVIKEKISIQLEAAAEYYLDERFAEKLKNQEPLLTFGNNYILFETSFLNEPKNLKQVIFDLKSSGYRPIFAHPERYIYLVNDFKKIVELYEAGVLIQINLMSLIGYYSPASKEFCKKLIDAKMVHFAGSDCHNIKHMEILKKIFDTPEFAKLSKIELLNNLV